MMAADVVRQEAQKPTFTGGPRDGEYVTHSADLAKVLPVKMHWPLQQAGAFGSGYVRGPDGNYHWRERMRL